MTVPDLYRRVTPDMVAQLRSIVGSVIYDEPERMLNYVHDEVMLDISRDKVPTMETLFNLIDLLASWKINPISLKRWGRFCPRRAGSGKLCPSVCT